ncbi:MAG: NAD-dependent epimerase/dehydratase family protein [Gammaproteobacteria bacterium]
MQDVLIIGCGYTGLPLAVRLMKMGYRVTGTARSAQRVDAMHAAGIEAEAGPLDDERTVRRLVALEPVLVTYFVPPQKKGPDPLPAILDVFGQQPPEAFVYASSTAVYGDRKGSWVDETTPLIEDGTADAGRIRAERRVGEAVNAAALPARICRISGIYGPGRTLEKPLQSGQYALVAGRDPWVGRIHVDDLVSGLIGAWQRGADGHVYNMVDRRPHRASEFASLAADLQGLPPPAVIDVSAARARYRPDEFRRKVSSKRIRCARLVEDLGVELRYPDYREGLPAAVTAAPIHGTE